MAAPKKPKKTEETVDLSERILRARAEKIEFEVEAKRGGYVRVDEVKALLREISATMRERLEGIPQVLARKLSTMKDPAEIEAVLKKEISAALQELNREEMRGLLPDDDDEEERPPAKKRPPQKAKADPEDDEDDEGFNPYGDDDD